MKLKNITSFNEFIFEANDIPEEFSNKTKFSESLVGRGIFSLLRYLKQGIDALRLEYLKQKLENEYFAGVLRFCAVKEIDLKTGSTPTKDSGGGGGGGASTNIKYKCELLNVDYTDTSNTLQDIIKYVDDFFVSVPTGVTPGFFTPEEEEVLNEMKRDKTTGDYKIKVNAIFKDLNDTYVPNAETGSDFTTEEAAINKHLDDIKAYLDWIKTNDICPTYKLTDNEKEVINKMNKCNNVEVKKRCDDIITKINESFYFHYDKKENYLINEKLSGKISSLTIEQILGDCLATNSKNISKVNLREYLAKQDIHKVEDIAWDALTTVWSKNESYQKEATSYINKESVVNIQYAASRFIYRIKKTPTYQGITPSSGGKTLWDEDSSLKHVWEKKVQSVRSNWQYFFIMSEVDPFVILNYQDALRKRDSALDGYKKGVETFTRDVVITSEYSSYGLKLVGECPKPPNLGQNQQVLASVSMSNKIYYLVFELNANVGQGLTAYKYIGNINLDKLKDDKITDHSKFKEYGFQYPPKAGGKPATEIYNQEINKDLGINHTITERTLSGIYFLAPGMDRIKTGSVNEIRIVLEYDRNSTTAYELANHPPQLSVKVLKNQRAKDITPSNGVFDISYKTLYNNSTTTMMFNHFATFESNNIDEFFDKFTVSKSKWIIDGDHMRFYKFT